MSGKSYCYRVRTKHILEKDLFRPLGNRPISNISAPEPLVALRWTCYEYHSAH